MAEIKESKDIQRKEFVELSGYLNTAYKDYIAARTLIRSDLLYRGVILSCTAIEKYLKANYFLCGKTKKIHDPKRLFLEIKKLQPNMKICHALNLDYIKCLSESYHLRYLDGDIFDKPDKNFYLCVSRNKFLAELDYSVDIFQAAIGVRKGEEPLKGAYSEDIETKNPLLFDDNYILNGINKTDFIECKQKVYEIGYDKKGVLEIHRKADNIKNDGVFCMEKSSYSDYQDIYNSNWA